MAINVNSTYTNKEDKTLFSHSFVLDSWCWNFIFVTLANNACIKESLNYYHGPGNPCGL